MSKTNDYFCRICIFHEGNIYKLFTIGYYKDGGYFITDLSEGSDLNYIVAKVGNKGTKGKIGTFNSPINENYTYQIEISKPKLSHHIDGTAHVSGHNIISGYEEDGTSKGLSIISGDLHSKNDGGPYWGFYIGINTLKHFPIIGINEKLLKKYHLIFNSEDKLNSIDGDPEKGDFNIIIEGYYIHKSELPKDMNDGYVHIKSHPTYGIIRLIPIKSPPECPYIFGIGIIKDFWGYDKDFFSYGGTPSFPDENGEWEQIAIILNNKNEVKTNFKNLER